MWDGVANLRALSEYERALLAGDPETPAEAIRELSSDNSLMVASSIAGNWSASTGTSRLCSLTTLSFVSLLRPIPTLLWA